MKPFPLLAALCALAVAAPARAAEPAPAAAPEPAPTGLQFDLDLVDRSIPLSGEANFTVPLRLGFHWHRFSFLLGLYFVRGALEDEQTGDFPHLFTESAWWLELAPLVRFHFWEPAAGGLTPFAQAEFDWAMVGHATSDATGGDSDLPRILGFAVGAGAEYLFSKNFGVNATVLFRYLHASQSSEAQGGEQTTRLSVLALGGSAGVNLYF